jgi:hypothetical protein
MPDGFTVYQYLELLRIWHQGLLEKEKTLSTGARVYQVLFFIQTVGIAITTTISGFLSSLVLGFIGNKDDLIIIILQSIITGLIVISGILTSFNYVFRPSATSAASLSASRQYSGLAKELIIEIKSYEVMFAGMSEEDVSKFSCPDVGKSRSRPDIGEYHIDMDYEVKNDLSVSFETYKNRLLYYSTREQLITSSEPGLILIGYYGRSVFDKTYSNILSTKDIEFLTTLPELLEDRHNKRKMQKIITRIFQHMGTTEEMVREKKN